MQGDFQPQAGQRGLLPLEFGLGRFQFALSEFHLVAVRLQVDLRQQLVLFDPIILLDEEGNNMPRYGLRSHVDDVRLHKGVFGN